jgi:hypothetical protein
MDTWMWVALAAAVAVMMALAAMSAMRRRRRHLRSRFGIEYQRAVEATNRRRAEHDLRERERRHGQLELRPLTESQRMRFARQWEELQSRFVDRPQVAVADADQIISDLMRVRGYPVEDFESKSALISVDHPDLVENYRKAHGVSMRNVEGRASTEDLRQAVVAYRSLFDEMLAVAVSERPRAGYPGSQRASN